MRVCARKIAILLTILCKMAIICHIVPKNPHKYSKKAVILQPNYLAYVCAYVYTRWKKEIIVRNKVEIRTGPSRDHVLTTLQSEQKKRQRKITNKR